MTEELLGGRYRLIEVVGGGGMAIVYRALDTFLDRSVAIKVMRKELLEDPTFVERFRQEAQAVARLSHPNIVSIYDVGESSQGYYIVMEFVEGSTLKTIIESGPLSVAAALDYGRQIADALIEAHNKKIIHRDIKPHNILITSSGRVKVTDFGIARAMTQATLVHTGTIIGSAHYFSPEQARGAFLDARSDIYSLGVVLYEMLSGVLPFDGTSPIAVAIKHIQDTPPAINELRPEIPTNVASIITRAMAKDPSQRYQSAEDMKQDIIKAEKDVEPKITPTPLPLEKPVEVSQERSRMTSATVPHKKRLKWWVPVLIFLAILLVLYFAYQSVMAFLYVPNVRVPNVVKMSIAQAENRITASGLNYRVSKQASTKVKRGLVVSQSPSAGSEVKRGRTIDLMESSGASLVVGGAPNVINQTLSEAKSTVSAVGLKMGSISRRYSSSVSKGLIVNQTPRPGSAIHVGGAIKVVISQGPKNSKVTLPDFTGQTLSQVQAEAQKLGLVVGQISYKPSSAPVGTIVKQTPAANTKVAMGSSIALVVSPGNGGQSAPSSGSTVQQQIASVHVPPSAPVNSKVKVVVVDSAGSKTWYDKTVQPNQTFTVTFRWIGQGTLLIYLNGSEVAHDSLPLPTGGTAKP